MRATDLLPLAREAGVGFAPGHRFHPVPAEGEGHIRVNFAAHTPEEIALGVHRLATALAEVGVRRRNPSPAQPQQRR